MEEKQEKKQEPEFKGNMGIVWLVGLLTILLGCTIVYTLKLCKENKDLKQTPIPQPPVIEEQQEQATNEENVNAVATEETKSEVKEDKNAKEVYGLSTKFKSLSDVAIKKMEKTYNQDKVNVNIAYDLNNDGKEEKITNKGNDIYLNSERIYKATSYTIGSIYIIDINNKDKQKELVLEELQDDGIIETTIYIYNSNKKIKKIKFDNNDLLYFDSNGKIISLNEITSNLTPLLAHGYYQYDGSKTSFKKINLRNVSNQRFVIKGQNDNGDNYYSYFMIKNKKELNKLINDTSLLKNYFIKEDTEITILSADGILKVKLKDGSIKYIYPIRGYLAG